MKVKIVKLDNDEMTIYQTIENVQITWIELDENDKDKLMTNFFIREDKTNKFTVISTDKITIM